MKRLLYLFALLGCIGLSHTAFAQTAYQTCAFSDPTHCYGIGPGSAGQAYVSNGAAAYPSFSSSLSGVSSVNGSIIPLSAGTLLGTTGSFTIGHCLQVASTSPLEASDAGAGCGAGAGTVTSFSFTNGNGFTGTVTNATTTPALSLAPSFTGVAYSNGTGLAAATAANIPAGGSANYVQFNSSGGLGGSTYLTWNGSSNVFNVGATSTPGTVSVGALDSMIVNGIAIPVPGFALNSNIQGVFENHSYTTGTSAGAARLYLARADGSISAPAIVVNGDHLGTIYGIGYNGVTNNYLAGGYEQFIVDGTPSSTAMPSDWILALAGATGAPAQVMRAYSNGGVVVGSPTGGNQGAGTLNAAGLYVNGVAALYSGGPLGTPSSGVGTNITGVNAASVGGYTLPCTVPTLVSGDYLTNNGTTCSWAAVSGSGTMTDGTGTTVIGAIPYSSATAHAYSLLASPTSGAGIYSVQFDPTSTTAVAPTVDQVGVATRSISGSTTTDTVLYSDVLGLIVHDKAATGTVTETLPTPTSLGNAKFGYTYCNDSAQTDTITPTTYTIAVNGGTAGASITVGTGICAQISVDPFNSTQWDAFTYGASSGGGGSTENVQLFTTSGTWTAPSGSPQTTQVTCVGAGAGGSSGAVEPSGTIAAGGAGGGGGSLVQAIFKTSSLGSSVTVTIGTGGTGGTAQTATGAGIAGNNGGNSTFGTFLTAFGGTGGSFVGSSADGGTGAGLTGVNVTLSVCAIGGGTGAGDGAKCSGGGAPGGGSSGTSPGAGTAGGASMLGGAGGGSGGALAATPVSLAGGAGGLAGALAGPAGGAAAGNGNAGSQIVTIYAGGTGGSGGGSNAAGTGGTGGAGGLGAGGGGGGASNTTSGAGGNGGNGECVVVTNY